MDEQQERESFRAYACAALAGLLSRPNTDPAYAVAASECRRYAAACLDAELKHFAARGER